MARGLKRELDLAPAAVAASPGLALALLPLFASFPGPLLLAAPDGSLRRANPAGLALAEALRADLSGLWTALREVAHEGRARHKRLAIAQAGREIVFDLTLLALEPPEEGVLVLGRDVTAERDLTQALVASRQMLRDLVACSADFAFETLADGTFGFVSAGGALGFAARELSGQAAMSLAAEEAAEDFPLTAARAVEGEAVRLRRRDGSVGEFEVCAVPVFGPDGGFAGTRGVARDVTEARESAAALASAHSAMAALARTDELTGLLNRRAFLDELPRRLGHLRRHNRHAALLYIDLDNFKLLNDLAGHAEGDSLLKSFAYETGRQCRAGDLVARLGGDEFAIWLEEIDRAGALSRARRLHRMGAELARRFPLPKARLGLSIGIALCDGAETAEALLGRADEAMYEAKRSGKGQAIVAASGTASAGRAAVGADPAREEEAGR